MKRLTCIIIGSLLGFSPAVFAENLLKEININSADGTFTAELVFTEPLPAQELVPEFMERSVQFDIKSARMKWKKDLRKIDADGLKSLFVYQADDQTLRARIIPSGALGELKDRVGAHTEGNILRLTVRPKRDPIVAMKPAMLESESDHAAMVIESESDEVAEGPQGTKAAAAIVEREMAAALSIGEKPTGIQPIRKAPEHLDKINERDESKIPVLTRPVKAAESQKKIWLKLVLSLFIIVGSGLALLQVGRWWSRKGAPEELKANIRVMNQHYLGPKKSLAIIRVAGEYILIGVTDHNISMIKTLALIDDEAPNEESKPFLDQLKTLSNEDDDFALSSIKDLVSGKLKGLRSI